MVEKILRCLGLCVRRGTRDSENLAEKIVFCPLKYGTETYISDKINQGLFLMGN